MNSTDKIFEEIKRAFMSKEEKKREKEKYDNFKDEEVTLMHHLEDMDNNWRSKHPVKITEYEKYFAPSLGLEKQKLQDKSIEKMRHEAQGQVKDKYDNAKDNILSSHSDDRKKTMDAIDRLSKEEEDELQKLKDKYRLSKEEAKNKSVKSGMLKSSMARLTQDMIDDKVKMDYADIKGDLGTRKNESIAQLEALNKARNRALDSLDVKRANEINGIIAKMRLEQEKENNKITDYNNDIDRKERDYAIKRMNNITKLKDKERAERRRQLSHERYNGYSGEKKDEYDTRLEMAMRLYNQMPSEIAVESIKDNPRLRSLLGYYYNKLLTMQRARVD